MAQTIKLKRSSVSGNTPTTSDLELGEVAINTYDGKMFIKKNDGSDSIVEIGGSSGTVTDAFKTIAVSGQTSVVADSATDTLTLVAGTNMSITTNAGGDTITFASTGSSGSATFLGLSDSPANFSGAAGKFLKVNSSANSIEFDTLNFDDLGTTPTTIAGYGITDALQLGTSATTALAGNTSIPSALTDLSISDGSSGQVLQTDGSGNFSFVNQTGGNSFGTIAVSGQSNVVADQGSDTLTLVAGSNVTLTTNASGDSVTIASSGSGGSSAADAIFEEYQFNATGGQTTFTGSDNNSQTLSYTPDAIQVFLNGVFLDPAVDYTATNGTSIVLSETVDANDYLQVIAYKKKISDGQTTVDTFSGNGSTTAFTLSLNPGDENNTRVFIDGVYQSKSNYAVSGTTLTFSTAPPNGTAVEVEIGNRVVTLDTTASIDLPDSVPLRFGTSQDLVIKHDGSNSFIQETGTGLLYVDATQLIVRNSAGTEDMAKFVENAAVQLYYDNGQKFATTNTGINVTGNITNTSGNFSIDTAGNLSFDADSGQVEFKDGGILKSLIDFTGSNVEIQSRVTDGDLLFRGQDGASFITALTLDMSNEGTAKFNHDIELLDGSKAIFGTDDDLRIQHTGSHAYLTNYTGHLVFGNESDDKQIQFRTDDGSGGSTVYMSIDGGTENTKFFKNTRHSDNVLLRLGDGNDLQLYHDGSSNIIQGSSTFAGTLYIQAKSGQSSLTATPNGNTTLHHSGNLKFETTSTGATVTGKLIVDQGVASAEPLQIGSSTSTQYTLQRWITSSHSGTEAYIIAYGASHSSEAGNFAIKNLEANSDIFFELTNNVKPLRLTNAGATFAGSINSGDITAGDSSTAKFVRSHYNDGSYMTLQGWGLEMNRGASYIRPSTDGDKTLYIGHANDSKDWHGIYFRTVNGLYMTGTRFIDASRNLSNIGTISSGAITSTGAVTTTSSDGFVISNIGRMKMNSNNLYLETETNGTGIVLNSRTGFVTFQNNGATAFQINSSNNATFQGTISSGDVEILDTSPLLTLKKSDETGRQSKLQHASGITKISSRNNASNGVIAFEGFTSSATQEYGRFDSSGDLIVGGTSSGANDAVSISNTGYIQAIINGDTAAYFNRRTSNGEIIRVQKDGSTVGSIESAYNTTTDMSIGSGNVRLLFYTNGSAIVPRAASNGSANGTIDLGNSGNKFKDLHLSGNIVGAGINSTANYTEFGTTTASNLVFKRTNASYLQADGTGGYFIFITNGRSTSYANRALALTTDNHAYFGGNIYSGAITSTGASSFTDLAIGGTADSNYDLKVYGLSRFQGVANFVSASNPIQVGGTTIVDASRNLTNIADITASGNIDISGTSKLHLSGAASTDYLEFDDDSTTYANATNTAVFASKSDIVLRTNTNDGGGGNFTISTGESSPTTLLFINESTGNVGIGTGSSSSSRLHVKSGSRGSVALRVTDSDTTNDILRSGPQADGDGYLQLRTVGGAGNVLFDASGVSYVMGGNFGIGENNPAAALHISGTSAEQIRLQRSGHDTFRIGLSHSVGIGIYNVTDSRQDFMISGSGDVGIGTSNPPANHRLHIKTAVDNSASQGLVIERSANSDRGYINYYGGAFRFVATDGDPLRFGHVSSPDRVTIDDAGQVGIGISSNIDSRLAVSGEMRIHSGSAYITHFNYQNTGSNFISQANSGGTHFRNSGNTLVSVTSGGNVKIYQSGAGIDFSSAANSHSGAAASTLNDYEEGTWTPGWVATTSYITVQSATYTKIGNVVTAHMYISNIGPATSADTQFITGLPFTVSGSNHYPAGTMAYSGTADVAGIGILGNTNTSYLYFHYIDGTSGSPLTRNNWNSIKSSGLTLIASITYRTDE